MLTDQIQYIHCRGSFSVTRLSPSRNSAEWNVYLELHINLSVFTISVHCIHIYYTSRENTLIPLDESHVSRLLATYVSVGSVTAGATQGLAPAIK